ncbi:MAG: hypothetical protein RIC55_33920 [Pirellulaceae bacterium]
MIAPYFPNRRQFCLRAVFLLLTATCMAASLWQWGPGRIYLSAAGVLAVLSSAHLVLMIGTFWLLETLLLPRLSPDGRGEQAPSARGGSTASDDRAA